MEEFFNEILIVIGSIILGILFYLFAPVFTAYAISRFLVKLVTLAIVMYFSYKIITFLTSKLVNIFPNNDLIQSMFCQLGILEGLNIFFTIVTILYLYKMIIKVLISS